MRKILKNTTMFIISLLFVSCFSLVACSKSHNEFETVSKVTFVSAGKEYSFSSIVTYNRRSKVLIGEKEFNTAPEECYRYFFESSKEETEFMKEEGNYRIIKSKSEVEKLKSKIEWLDDLSGVGETPDDPPIYTCTTTKNILGTSYTYHKYTNISNRYSLVQVKVENDTTILVKNSTSTTTYQVTSYSITYLE